MADNNIGKATVTDLTNGVETYSPDTASIDDAQANEFKYNNPDWKTWLGYYKAHPEMKGVVTALAIWTIGQGWTTDAMTEVILDHITGWGEDSFQSIIENAMRVMKINGDSYTEIIRDGKKLVNLKPLNPGRMTHILNKEGIITGYEYRSLDGKKAKPLEPDQVLHLCNDRMASEIHGTSIIKSVKWNIDARFEAMKDWRRISHRSTIRILYVDMENTTKLNTVKTQYKDAIDKGELLILPVKKGDATLEDLTLPPIANFLNWIQYLENNYYQTVGVPRVIATSENFTEAASKVGFLTFEPVYTREQTLLEADLWNQLGIKIKFNRPVSLGSNMQESEKKNTGQTSIQPNETQATMSRSE